MRISNLVDLNQPAEEIAAYRPQPDAIVAGDPQQIVHTHFTSPCGQLQSGVWEGAPGTWRVNFTENEYCEILAGVSVLRDEDGAARTVRTGDRFLIPAGFKGTWEVVESCRKVFVSVQFDDSGRA
ncbi:cupin domain-containing protein [Paraburkholderia sp.]|uniref:cupin domain-containing protein n=1 Tax=Paraburkholderia sp. TaxID=1926495 RepID=UPI0023A6DAF1|nr:cupin domain-containing protein [Paraburkholderia sp.]MDE1179062.1 cupin domain-containing protein [Paraburkholderia sp.]